MLLCNIRLYISYYTIESKWIMNRSLWESKNAFSGTAFSGTAFSGTAFSGTTFSGTAFRRAALKLRSSSL